MDERSEQSVVDRSVVEKSGVDKSAAERTAAPATAPIASEGGAPPGTESAGAKKERGPLYWFWHHSKTRIQARYREHRAAVIISLVLLALIAIHLRPYLHGPLIQARKNLIVFLIAGPVLWIVVRQLAKRHWKQKASGVAAALLFAAAAAYGGKSVYEYLRYYDRYRTLEIVRLTELPVSGFERIQPRNSVFSLAHEVMTESESPTQPDFVRIGDDYRWTLAIEPAYPISRLLGDVTQVYSLSAVSPSPDFSKDNRKDVSFQVGEQLLWSKNTKTSVVRSLGLFRFFNYEPADVTYVTNDDGKWVQVVSLIRWRGIFFVHPEFGGVQLIEQTKGGFLESLKRLVFGTGRWIPPSRIAEHKFLSGQNILPHTVSRHVGNSFRFQNGFFAPFPGYHVGDVRIPDMADDENNQPFSGYFTLPGNDEGGLFHYFALEPFDPDKQGLNTSVFVPADGTPKVYVYLHHEEDGSLTGVSAIAAKVMESRKHYDWSRNKPVEHRPFIRVMAGETRFFWLTTVVTLKGEEGTRRFIAGTVPDVVLTDARYSTPVWVNSLAPDTWGEQIKKDLSAVWGID